MPPQQTDLSSALVVNGEIVAVLATLRQNSKWAHPQTQGDSGSALIIHSFRQLRRQLFLWPDFKAVEPLLYLSPFLEAVRSLETNGPITGTALSAVYKFIHHSLFDESTPHAVEAINAIVDAVTHCRFEATDQASDEVVLLKILQVLLAALRSPVGHLLSDSSVCNIVQAAFRIGHQSGREGELLQRTSRHTLIEVNRTVFKRLAENPFSLALAKPDEDTLVSEDAQDSETLKGPYGERCLVEFARFSFSLLTIDEQKDDLGILGLALICASLETAGEHIRRYPMLLKMYQKDMFHSLAKVDASSNLAVFSYLGSIMLHLYGKLAPWFKTQIDSFMRNVLFRLADGHECTEEQREAAIESIVDLCRQPNFCREIFANFDCDLCSANLFEELVLVLTKSSKSGDYGLSSIQLLSLEGMISMIRFLAERCDANDGSVTASPPGTSVTPDKIRKLWKNHLASYSNEVTDTSAWLEDRPEHLALKHRLSVAVDHFNREPKKAIEYLESEGLFPQDRDPELIALFFRLTPGLSKRLLGEYLGESKEFNVQVMECYIRSFDLRGLDIVEALRGFLCTFLIPGEAQKISRILEVFSAHFHSYETNQALFHDESVAYVLSYSIIMLNTDLWNDQVKRKMTEEQFIRNNRGINNDKDLPLEVLQNIYKSIKDEEIKLDFEEGPQKRRWVKADTAGPPFVRLDSAVSAASLERDVFSMLCEPTIKALQSVLTLAGNEKIVSEALDGVILVARVAAHHKQPQVLDELLQLLYPFTKLRVSALEQRSVLPFGESMKARKAAMTLFSLVGRFGDYVRGGWREVVECIVMLHRLGLLPEKILEGDDLNSKTEANGLDEEGNPGMPRSDSYSIFSSFTGRFASFLSIDAETASLEAAEREEKAMERGLRCVEGCPIEEIFTDSRFLQGDSLVSLGDALVAAFTDDAEIKRYPSTTRARDIQEVGVVCLHLLLTITLRNRDRIDMLWGLVSKTIATIIKNAKEPTQLVSKAVFGLLHLCQRLLPYKEEIADELLSSLQLVLKLDVAVAEVFAERITEEVLQLVKANLAYIKSTLGWKTICALLAISASHPAAAEKGFQALETLLIGGTGNVTEENFLPCMETLTCFIQGRVGGDRTAAALELLASTGMGIVKSASQAESAEDKNFLKWVHILKMLSEVALSEEREHKHHALILLQRLLLANEVVDMAPTLIRESFETVLFPLFSDVLKDLPQQARGPHVVEYCGVVKQAISLLSRCFLMHLRGLGGLEDFEDLWFTVLNYFKECKTAAKSYDEIAEMIPEKIKNLMLVMYNLCKEGVVIKTKGETPKDFWEKSWEFVATISPDLTPDIVS